MVMSSIRISLFFGPSFLKSFIPLIFDVMIFWDVIEYILYGSILSSDLLFNARLVIKWCLNLHFLYSLNSTSIEQALECAWYVFITVDSVYCQNVYVYVLHVYKVYVCVC